MLARLAGTVAAPKQGSPLYFARLRGGRYDWDDLHRLLRANERLEAEDVLRSVGARFSVLRNLSDLEREVIAGAKSGWNEPLAERLRQEIRSRLLRR